MVDKPTAINLAELKTQPEAPRKLTGQQREFVRLYVLYDDHNRAYREAFRRGDGTLPKSVPASAKRLLEKPHVLAAIDIERKRIANQHRISEAEVIAHFRKVRDDAYEQSAYNASLRANEALAKIGGFYKDTGVTVNVPTPATFLRGGTAEEKADSRRILERAAALGVSPTTPPPDTE